MAKTLLNYKSLIHEDLETGKFHISIVRELPGGGEEEVVPKSPPLDDRATAQKMADMIFQIVITSLEAEGISAQMPMQN